MKIDTRTNFRFLENQKSEDISEHWEEAAKLVNTYSGLLEHPIRSFRDISLHKKLKPSTYIGYFPNKFEQLGEFKLFQDVGIKFPPYNDNRIYWDFDGCKYNANYRKYASFYILLSKYINWNNVNIICDIGGGYGGLAELFSYNLQNKNYIMIDLVETLMVAMKYLVKNITSHQIYYVQSLDELKKVCKEKNVIMLIDTNHLNKWREEIRNILNIDLFINADSFIEMTKEQVGSYFDFIQKFDCYLFHHNRVNRQTSKDLNETAKFPYDKNWVTLYENKLRRRKSNLIIHQKLTRRK